MNLNDFFEKHPYAREIETSLTQEDILKEPAMMVLSDTIFDEVTINGHTYKRKRKLSHHGKNGF